MMDTLIAHLWQSTLCVVAAWLLTVLLRRNGAHIRYWIWFAASLKFLLPFAALVRIGSIFEFHRPVAPAANWVQTAAVYGQQFILPPALLSSSVENAVSPSPLSTETILLVAWLLGFLLIAAIWSRRFAHVWTIRKRASQIQLANCPIPALSSASVIEPGVFGIRRPVLLLPARVLDSLTEPQLAAIIAHELCHVRRRDNLTAAIHMAVQSIFWFHPLVWWLGTRLVDERERACDESVLNVCGRPNEYAQGILNVCRLCVESPVRCVSGVSGADLKQRIERIMRGPAVVGMSPVSKATIAATAAAALIVPLITGMIDPRTGAAQISSDTPRFEAVSVKPCKTESGQMRGAGGESSPGRLVTGCDLLADEQGLGLIQRAYVRFAGGHMNSFGIVPIVGGPKWIHSDMYRIEATASGHPGLEMMSGPMLQALLQDRFKLKVRREMKKGPVYALTVSGNSSRLKPFHEGECLPMPLTAPRPIPRPPDGQKYCNSLVGIVNPSIVAEGNTLVEFSKLLNLVLDRPVIDKTGLTGRFNIHLEFAKDMNTPGLQGLPPLPDAPPPDPGRTTIFNSIQEQLGLKLTPSTGPIEKLVIDHIERPSEN